MNDLIKDILPVCYETLGPLWSSYQDVISELLSQVRSDLPPEALPEHYAVRRGKELRPLVALLCGRCLGIRVDDEPNLLVSAAAIELMHIASLLHDDVLDNARIRHGGPTVNASFSSKMAILSGDYLLGVAAQLVSEMHCSALLEMFTHTILLLTRGELLEEHYVRQPITAQTYFEITDGKTGSLFALAAMSSQLIVPLHRKEVVDALRTFGMTLGTLFQMCDDFLDYGMGSDTGKPLLQDLHAGKMTWPVIIALHDATLAKKQSPWISIWLRYLSRPSKELEHTIVDWVHTEVNTLEYADVLPMAMEALEVLPDNIYRECLQGLLFYAIGRDK